MEPSPRQAFLAAAEEQARDSTYWIGEQGEFAMFDVSAAYLHGDARLIIARAIEHIEGLIQGRNNDKVGSIGQLARSEGLPPQIRRQFAQLAEQHGRGPFTEAEAQNAVHCFYYVLFGRVGR